MASAYRLMVRQGCEAFRRVRPHCLEHREPGAAALVTAPDQEALGDEPVEGVQVGAGDRFCRLDGRAPGEHGEPRETRLLSIIEQAVTPVERRAQCLLARRSVARPGSECAQRLVQTGGDLAR